MFKKNISTKSLSTLTIGALGMSLASFTNAESFDDRWYVAPSVSYIIPDSERKTENGTGFKLGVGKAVSEKWNIELSGVYDSMDAKKNGVDVTQMGGFFDGLYVLNRSEKFSPYGVLGIGLLNTEFGSDNDVNPAMHVGAGFMYDFSDYGAGIRSDIRYRLDQDNRLPDADRFGDIVVNLGLYIPLGKKQAKTAAAATLIPAVLKSEPKVTVNDTDNDGIPDSKDKCNNTPSGVKIDAYGCEIDKDGDKVADSKDQCDNTPAGVSVDAFGCPVDSDKDGVADYQDKCKNNLPGDIVNAMGCEPDSDGDGVADARDACPNSITTRDTGLDGCSLNDIVNTQKYGFEMASAELNLPARNLLSILAERLKTHPSKAIEIVGHTDNTGPTWFNNRLSMERAEAIKQFLIDQGVNESRLITKGIGPNSPIADNDTDQGRAQNRRVEMFVMD